MVINDVDVDDYKNVFLQKMNLQVENILKILQLKLSRWIP